MDFGPVLVLVEVAGLVVVVGLVVIVGLVVVVAQEKQPSVGVVEYCTLEGSKAAAGRRLASQVDKE